MFLLMFVGGYICKFTHNDLLFHIGYTYATFVQYLLDLLVPRPGIVLPVSPNGTVRTGKRGKRRTRAAERGRGTPARMRTLNLDRRGTTDLLT